MESPPRHWFVDQYPDEWTVSQRIKPNLKGWPHSAGPFSTKAQALAWALKNIEYQGI